MSEQEFPASLETPAEARRFASTVLAGALTPERHTAVLDDVLLVVSELVTNAVRAGSPVVRLRVSLTDRGRVAVSVTDAAHGWPHPRVTSSNDPGGRGLALVSAVAATWGARLDEGSKTVWAELAVPS